MGCTSGASGGGAGKSAQRGENAGQLKPTHARQIEDMNELQLEREITKLER